MDELKILFPGEKVEFEKFDAEVFPIGFNQIKNFSETLVNALRAVFSKIDLNESDLDDSEKMKQVGIRIISLLSPIATKDLLGIFKECIVIKTKPNKDEEEGDIIPNGIEQIPHWNIPPLITAWLEVSFLGEEKIHPWIKAVREIGGKIGKLDLSSLSD